MTVEDDIREAIAYLSKVPVESVMGVHVASIIGDIATVSYVGIRGKVRTVELDLSKQYMKMFLGEKDD